MRQRLYIDTSVFGGLFDEEFKEFTQPLFERVSAGEFIILFSTVTQEELSTVIQLKDINVSLFLDNYF